MVGTEVELIQFSCCSCSASRYSLGIPSSPVRDLILILVAQRSGNVSTYIMAESGVDLTLIKSYHVSYNLYSSLSSCPESLSNFANTSLSC